MRNITSIMVLPPTSRLLASNTCMKLPISKQCASEKKIYWGRSGILLAIFEITLSQFYRKTNPEYTVQYLLFHIFLFSIKVDKNILQHIIFFTIDPQSVCRSRIFAVHQTVVNEVERFAATTILLSQPKILNFVQAYLTLRKHPGNNSFIFSVRFSRLSFGNARGLSQQLKSAIDDSFSEEAGVCTYCTLLFLR